MARRTATPMAEADWRRYGSLELTPPSPLPSLSAMRTVCGARDGAVPRCVVRPWPIRGIAREPWVLRDHWLTSPTRRPWSFRGQSSDPRTLLGRVGLDHPQLRRPTHPGSRRGTGGTNNTVLSCRSAPQARDIPDHRRRAQATGRRSPAPVTSSNPHGWPWSSPWLHYCGPIVDAGDRCCPAVATALRKS
jgi:hypothetical protein